MRAVKRDAFAMDDVDRHARAVFRDGEIAHDDRVVEVEVVAAVELRANEAIAARFVARNRLRLHEAHRAHENIIARETLADLDIGHWRDGKIALRLAVEREDPDRRRST